MRTGIDDGETVVVETRRGKIEIRVPSHIVPEVISILPNRIRNCHFYVLLDQTLQRPRPFAVRWKR